MKTNVRTARRRRNGVWIARFETLEDRALLSTAGDAFGDWDARAAAAQIAPDRLLVHFRAGATESEKDLATNGLDRATSTVLYSGGAGGGGEVHVVTLEAGTKLSTAAAMLARRSSVELVEADWVVQADAVPDDPYYLSNNLWGVGGDATAPASIYGSQAAEAWQAGNTGADSVYVAVIDTGVFIDHEDLRPNIWTNDGEIPGNGIDDDANGYVDDVNGFDFYNDDGSVYDPADFDTHGTHVAGTIAAVGNNGKGVVGVNWNAKIIPVKFLGPNGGYTSDAVQAIDYVTKLRTEKGLKVVAANNSWGSTGGYSAALDAAIGRMTQADIVFVASAGNNGSNNDATAYYPANYANNLVLSVAAIDANGNRPSWSNYGSTKVDLGAPGVSVLSTLPANTYGYYSGTSMAAPHVAGAAALFAAADPTLTAAQIRSKILADTIPTSSMQGITATGGRLDTSGALVPAGEVLNTGFETPALGTGAFRYRPTGASWTFTGGSGVSSNDSGFTAGNPVAPEGSQVAFLQGTGSISQTVSRAAGIHRLSFQSAQRGNWQQGGYHDFRVLIDGQEVGRARASGVAYQTFEFVTTLTAGAHVVTFSGLNSAGGDNTSLIDAVRLETAVLPSPGDRGFERPILAPGTFANRPSGTAWTFGGAAGVSANGSGYTVGNAASPEGSQVAYLQTTGSVSQAIDFGAGGRFAVDLLAAQRGNWQQGGYHDFDVLVDGVLISTVRASDKSYRRYRSAWFDVASGLHTIQLRGRNTAGGDNTTLLDDVRLVDV